MKEGKRCEKERKIIRFSPSPSVEEKKRKIQPEMIVHTTGVGKDAGEEEEKQAAKTATERREKTATANDDDEDDLHSGSY